MKTDPGTNILLTPYAKRLRSYVAANLAGQSRRPRKGVSKAAQAQARTAQAEAWLDEHTPGWRSRRAQPKAGVTVITLSKEDEE